MRELRSRTETAGPFTVAPGAQGLVAVDRPLPPVRFKLGRHVLNWSRHLMATVGVFTIGAFVIGFTPIPEQIGGVTGRIEAAVLRARTDSQAEMAKKIAQVQQQATVDPQREIQAWQQGLQADLTTLTAALDGTKTLLVQKATADFQARNMLLDKDAQLQADRVRQIMQVQAQLEQGNIASAQAADVLKNIGNALSMDTTRLRQQSEALKIEVLDSVTKVTPISPDNGAGIMDPVKPGGMLDPDVQVAMGDLERRIAVIQERFAVRGFTPSSAQAPRP